MVDDLVIREQRHERLVEHGQHACGGYENHRHRDHQTGAIARRIMISRHGLKLYSGSREVNMTRITSRWMVFSVALAILVGATQAQAAAKTAKYYFKIFEINVGNAADPSIESMARELLEKDLGSRPEFTSDLGEATNDDAVVAKLKSRRLQGFKVSLRLDKLAKEAKAPRPGGRLKQLAVDVKLSVFGTTLPGEKLAFAGNGEAAVEAEVVEKRMDEETAQMVRDVMVQAIKQAVDQAVLKLSIPKSVPMNESKRKRKKT